MTDSMNFGPDWIRNLSSEGTTTSGGTSGVPKYQLAEYRYGREEMLALFDKNSKPPQSLLAFKGLYSEPTLLPLALLPNTEEERAWQTRPVSTMGGSARGRGGPLDRGGRVSRGGRGGYQNYGRPVTTYDSGWGNTVEQTEWSPRKDFNMRSANDNWRRSRTGEDEGEGWRGSTHARSPHEKWGRSTSWRGGDGDLEERQGNSIPGRNNTGWSDGVRSHGMKKSWDNEDHLPEWVTENVDGGGTFDSTGAFHNSDEEQGGDTTKSTKKESVLQKSSSQQHINPNKANFTSLQTSKSVASLTSKIQNNSNKVKEKPDENDVETQYSAKGNNNLPQSQSSAVSSNEKIQKIVEGQQKNNDLKQQNENNQIESQMDNNGSFRNISPPSTNSKKVEDDFKIQEDIILKLVDDDIPKTQKIGSGESTSTTNIQGSPNLEPPVAVPDQWFYQDPQGQMQGPFSGTEMAEWYKAGYFNGQLKVRRPCDELFYLLGELVTLCDGANPFLTNKRFPPLKPDPATLPENDLLQYQYLMALRQAQSRMSSEPWNAALSLQQQEAAAQRLMLNPQDLTFLHQGNSAAANPLMHMISQMQQANKMPAPPEKTANLDPRLVQLSNLQYQNRLPPTSTIPNPLTSRLPGLTEGLNLPGVLGTHPLAIVNLQRPMAGHNTVVDNLVTKPPEDPISSLLKQLQQQKQQAAAGITLDSLWQTSGNQFPVNSTPQQQWQQNEASISMWDNLSKPDMMHQQQQDLLNHKLEMNNSSSSSSEQLEQKSSKKNGTTATSSKMEKKKKEQQEEKQAKKEAEEKRKNEQRKLEAEKKALEEKKKKEEERIRKEIEKAKKEADEKRMRELEEKRKLKEQRKAEEENRKKLEEQRKAEEERAKREAKEREENAKREAARLAQEQAMRNSKIAPWSQPSSAQGLTLQEIQKLEKEKARQEAAILQQQKQMLEFQRQQEEKAAANFTWANKAKENSRQIVKSLAEIQAEEQERLARQAAEARLLALQKEKDQPQLQNSAMNIWNSQNISWSSNTNNSTTQQWSSNINSAGLWEDTPGKQQQSQIKPSTNSKNSTTTVGKTQNVQQQKSKAKNKKEDNVNSTKTNHNPMDEFTEWCCKTLSNINSQIDIPTFVTFLRDIESALDVREYCKDYLGENVQAQQFATQFLEKRRSFKPKNQAPKDDMCSPAPAITPSLHSNNEFQEVKGKNKKNKKNKMLKVDNRILGFNVTSAPDRINVGDRDYGDNS